MDDGWLESRLAGNGTADRGGFTEAYLTEEGFTQEARKREVSSVLALLGLYDRWMSTWRWKSPTLQPLAAGQAPGRRRCRAAVPAVHEVHL